MLFISSPKKYFIFSCHHPHCNTCQPQTDRQEQKDRLTRIHFSTQKLDFFGCQPWNNSNKQFLRGWYCFQSKMQPHSHLRNLDSRGVKTLLFLTAAVPPALYNSHSIFYIPCYSVLHTHIANRK